MTKEEKLQKIYEVIMTQNQEILYSCKRVRAAWSYGTMTQYDFEEVEPSCMIGDVLDRLAINNKEMLSIVLVHWEFLRKPIDSQSEECIDYVLSLIESVE